MTKIDTIELPVTVNAIRIDGKKLTQSTFKQITERNPFTMLYGDGYPWLSWDPESNEDAYDGVRIIARHSYGLEKNDKRLHYLWWRDGELFKSSLPEYDQDNTLHKVGSDFENDIRQREFVLDMAKQQLEASEISREFWEKVFSGYTDALSSYLDSDFEQNAAPNETVKEHVDAIDNALLDLTWTLVKSDKDLSGALNENEAAKQALFQEAQRIAPLIIDCYALDIPAMKTAVDGFTAWSEQYLQCIICAPKIIVGA